MNEILLGDCKELIRSIPDDSIDLIFTDPPYDKESVHLYAWLAEAAARVLKPGGFIMCYSGSYYFDRVIADMLQHLEYFMLCMTYEPGNNCKIFNRNVIQMSKLMPVFYKPVPGKEAHKAYHQMVTVFRTNNDKSFHKWGQDIACARYYIHCLSQPGDIVLEPFAGGGTTCIAAMQEGRNFIAFEKDEQSWGTATKRLQLWQPKLLTSFSEQLELTEIAIKKT